LTTTLFYGKIYKKGGAILGKIRLNENAEVVKTIKDGLKAKGGYCPCRLERTEDNKCICKEFREQMADPDFEGYCHCMLYYKSKE
jgi:ferredoxin-thioredoxin reductase catalytic subunit